VRLPSADDLFRPTADPTADPTARAAAREAGTEAAPTGDPAQPRVRAVPEPDPREESTRRRRSSGRVRHDEKMTVYVTSDELLELEHARLTLRREHGVAIDRGRLVREAVAIVLADLEANGGSSSLVQRLAGE
jgi:hypothetical protein